MAVSYSSQHAALLGKIIAVLPASTRAKTRAFVQGFYALSTVNDLEELTPTRAVDIAIACEAFHAARPKKAQKSRLQK